MKTKLLASLIAPALLAFASCVTPVPSKPVQAPLVVADFEPYLATGTAKLTGQAFLKTRGGDVKYAAGQEVTLTPATAFIKEVRAIRDAGFVPSNVTVETSDILTKYIRTTIADGTGNFEFKDLPAGEYLVETSVYWEFHNGNGMRRTGGLVREFVTIVDGQSARVILSK